jgi:putative acetyltransferase
MNKTPNAPPAFEISRALNLSAEIRALIGELDQHLFQNYLPEQQHALALAELFQPHIRFFVARMAGVAVGCGGVALFSDFAEVKRMYVRSEARGRGAADAIMSRLIAEAVAKNLKIMRLETGTRSFAALRFYQRYGFQPCAIFEPYASMAPPEIAESVFLEKRV